MRYPLSIKELLSLLYQNKEVMEMLFGYKDSLNKNELIAREDMTEEKMEKLILSGIVHENNHIISLDDRIVTFIEEFLEIGEVTTSFINDNIQELKDNLRYYRMDNGNVKFLKNIKKYLYRINSTTSREVIKLHKNIDDTYKNQSNYQIKLEELDKYKQKRDDILNLIKETEQLISESQGFFNTVSDSELNSILLELRYTLVQNRDYLTEIQTQIIDYINKIQYQAAIYKKIQRLKELKDSEELKYKTNFIDIISNEKAIVLNKRPVFKTRLSLDFLYSDAGSILAGKVANKLQILNNLDRKPAGKISGDISESTEEQSVKLNVEALVAKFTISDKDLFTFLMEYEFPKELGSIEEERKISLYVEICIDHEQALHFTGQFAYKILSGEQNKKIGYAVIVPADKATKKASKKSNANITENGN